MNYSMALRASEAMAGARSSTVADGRSPGANLGGLGELAEMPRPFPEQVGDTQLRGEGKRAREAAQDTMLKGWGKDRPRSRARAGAPASIRGSTTINVTREAPWAVPRGSPPPVRGSRRRGRSSAPS